MGGTFTNWNSLESAMRKEVVSAGNTQGGGGTAEGRRDRG